MKNPITVRSKTIKCVYAAAVGTAFQLSFRLPSYVGVQLALIFVSVTLYSAPMLINIQTIKNYETESIKKFIVTDLLFVFAPALIACVLTELVYIAVASIPDYSEGMGSLIFICISVLLTLCFWLGYLIINAVYNRLSG